jgi:murein endopeptidase
VTAVRGIGTGLLTLALIAGAAIAGSRLGSADSETATQPAPATPEVAAPAPAPPEVAAPVPPVPAVPSPPARPAIRWRESRPLGSHSAGALAAGVRLPIEGPDFFTWDPVKRSWGNRSWRLVGDDDAVRTVLRVIRAHRAGHAGAPRVGIGDVSRPRGGDFGPRFGLPGHVSHQNGLDVDLYYPRLDRLELAPTRVRQIDRRLSQDLVDRFVAAGAEKVFVGPATGLRGPAEVVVPLIHHDNHLHVRFPIGFAS